MPLSPQVAAQIAELLNSQNQLTVPYTAERVLRDQEQYIIRLDENSELMGVVELKRIQWYQCEIGHLSVHPDFKRNGVGSWLVQAAEDRARDLGARIAQCTIRAGNTKSEGLFKKHGYGPTVTFLNEQSGNKVVVFVRHVAATYGTSVIRDTSLRWIPVLEPPGNVFHHSRAELVEMLAVRHRVVVGTGIGPGSAYGVAARRLSSGDFGQTLVIALRNEEIDLNYTEKEEIKREHGETLTGGYHAILEQLPKSSIRLEILFFLLELIAEAWDTTVGALHRQTWNLDVDSEIFSCALERNVGASTS